MRTSPSSVLVFPAGMPSSLAWAQRAAHAGVRVVGASSLAQDPAQSHYREWAWLPWSGDPEFAIALVRTVSENQIDTVFTPHLVVWSVLRKLLPSLAPHVRLEPEQLWAADFADYRECFQMAARFDREALPLAAAGSPVPSVPVLQLAALVRLFGLVPGQCDHEKLEALAAIFRWMPKGDLVEIGSFWGRSALALAFLSRHFEIGNLLCVDPWKKEELRQGIPEVDASCDDLAMDEVFDAFRINLAPFLGGVNYLRSRSSDAASVYGTERCVTTVDFGRIPYTGQIALLHIDGNHALEAVRSDIRQWAPWVRPGGWIVFDDYCWPFGDGPRIAADEFCTAPGRNLATAFAAGGSLFLQVMPSRAPATPGRR